MNEPASQRVLTVDVGGSNVKALLEGLPTEEVRRVPSGAALDPAGLVERVRELARGWEHDRVSIGFPGPVVDGAVVAEPHNLGSGWVGFDFAAALGTPVRLVNDAAMQALGSYEGGKMLFLGLGTGLGSALVGPGCLLPLELAHLPYKKGKSYEHYVGERGLERRGKSRWRKTVAEVCALLRTALLADYVVLGGGNVRLLDELPERCRRGDNDLAFEGGFRLWRS